MSQLCKACQASGLPIMPVRYAVVPNEVTAKLPDWASGARVKDVSLGDEFHYALRTVRAGYVYLFYSKNARGSNVWECYTVTEDGILQLQPSPKAANPPKDSIVCQTAGHSNSRLHHLIIDKPEKCGPSWIAFSEHKWSDETLAQYASDAKLRNARMQAIDPKSMASGSKNPHSSPASQSVIESVMEYSNGFSNAQLPYDQQMPYFSKRDGSFEKKQLTKVSTLYRVCSRKGVAAETLQYMQFRAKKSAGGTNTPHVMALWDAIGVVHELNGYRNDPAAYIALYNNEREFQLDTIVTIDALKEFLAQRRGEVVDSLWDLPQENHTSYPMYRNEAGREESRKKAMAKSWDKYANNIDQAAFNKFKSNQTELITTAESIAEKRTQVLVRWLDAPLFIDTLEDCHDENPNDGLIFEGVIGCGIIGINSCASGRAKLQAWMGQIEIGKTSLFYRALAQNQKELVAELKLYLAQAKENKDKPYTEADFKQAMKPLTFGQKLFDLYKKSLSLAATNAKAIKDAANPTASPSAKAFNIGLKAAPTAKLDLIIKTGGDTFFKTFLPAFNTAASPATAGSAGHVLGEKFIQMVLGTRALVAPSDITNLIKEQHANDVLRSQEERRLENKSKPHRKPLTSKKIIEKEAAFRANQGAKLGKAWETFQKSKPDDHLLAVKDMRLTVLVILIEGINLTRLIAFYHDDAATKALITASAMSLTAGIIDLSATPIKSALGADSRSFQRMKLAGGSLSTVAGIIGFFVDISFARKEAKKDNYLVAGLYAGKAALGGAAALLTGASTFTYAAPIVLRVSSSVAITEVASAIGGRAAGIIATRIFFMSVGLWLTVGAFAIQIIIWQVMDDALESWLNLTPFGKNKDNQGAYLDSTEMKHALEASLKEFAAQ